ncbi:condensation domain-containing protein [Streptomyces sp. NPDC050548]|uniref:condensation domain-containing protein n=1 Tax=Streptomyces sp. NPDC050548 TaxID=3365629 RepID=UPI0037B48F32
MADEPSAASTSTRFSPAEAVMAQVWEDVLGVDGVGLDDDFFACGGDSLLAITVVAEAGRRGLRIALPQLFEHPTVRGTCRASAHGGPDRPPARVDLLSPADRAKVPAHVQEVMPATRLQLGLIYESLMSAGAQYVCTAAHDIRKPLDEATLREALARVASRHEMLRVRFELGGFSEAVQIVEHGVEIPLTVADHSALDASALEKRTALVMKELGRPFDPETAPLVRFHAAATGAESYRLTYSFHHAVLDGWSAANLLHETVTVYAGLLDGDVPELARPLPYAEYVRLERAAARSEEAVRHFEAWARGEEHRPARAVPHPPRMTEFEARVSRADTETLFACAAARGLPVKSLLLTAHGAAVAAERGRPVVDVAMMMIGRPEQEGTDLTLGLFVNYLPIRLDLRGTTWAGAARRAFDAERELLPHRRFPYADALGIVGSRPFEVCFNYAHLRRNIQLVEAGVVARGQYSDLGVGIPVVVDVHNTGDGLAVRVSVDTSRHDAALGSRLLSRLLEGIRLMAGSPETECLPSTATVRRSSGERERAEK